MNKDRWASAVLLGSDSYLHVPPTRTGANGPSAGSSERTARGMLSTRGGGTVVDAAQGSLINEEEEMDSDRFISYPEVRNYSKSDEK